MTPAEQEQAPSEEARKAAEAWAQVEYEQYQHYVSPGCSARIARLLDQVAAEARREERLACLLAAETAARMLIPVSEVIARIRARGQS